MITKTVYIAVDGAQFDVESECESYETSLKAVTDEITLLLGDVRPTGVDEFVQHPAGTLKRLNARLSSLNAHLPGSPFRALGVLSRNIDHLDREFAESLSSGNHFPHMARCILVRGDDADLIAFREDLAARELAAQASFVPPRR